VSCAGCRAAFREARLLRLPLFPIIVGSDGAFVVGSDISHATLSDSDENGLGDLAAALRAEVERRQRGIPATGGYRFKSFLSYSHRDKTDARWLHRALERYRLPRQLVGRHTEFGEVPHRFGRVFRDDEELKGAADLGALINGALEESETLVVICSPRSARSVYVDQEVTAFKRLGRESRIVPVIIDGKPHDAEANCFPAALMRAAGPDGRLTDAVAEPIAVDIREHGRRRTLLKVVAGVTGLDFDELEQRERRRRQEQRLLVGGAAAVALLALGLTAAVVDQIEARRAVVADAAEVLLQRQPVAAARLALAGLPTSSDLLPFDPAAPAPSLKATGYAYATRPLDPTKRYQSAVFSDDGERLVTLDGNGEVVVWDGRTLQPLNVLDFTYYGGPTSYQSVDVAPGGTRLVTTPAGDDAAQLWDLRTGARIASLGESPARLLTVKFARDGQWALAVFVGAPAKLFGLADGSEVATFATGSYAAELSPDGRRVVLPGPGDGMVTLWDAQTGKVIAELEVGANPQHPRFTPDSSRLLTASSALGALLWDTNEGRRLAQIGGPDGAERAVLSADGLRLATLDSEGIASLWDAMTGRRIAIIGEPGTAELAFAEGAGKVVTATRSLQAFVSDAASGAPVGRLGEPGEGYRLYFSASGRRVVFLTKSMSAVLRDAGTGALIARLGGENDAYRPSVSPDRRIFAAADANHWVRQWDMETGEPIGALAGPREGNSWEIDRDRRLAVTLGVFGEGLVRHIDVSLDGTPEALRTHVCRVNRDAIGRFESSERQSSNLVRKWLAGRPWHPCDWQGLRLPEGWAQAIRYWAVRAGLPFDYAPEETSAWTRQQASSAAATRP
jgi:WD40 repeat protein